ncbi:LysE family translocator [Desulfospira joergensenii]|uniref:LysE family translocator n=1 Tax=Desulfospira joergensenii TaxID=53329 RepID=UPI0003B7B2A3|nr:LysE family transporter [Desulfospira joergensenii]
MEIKYLIKGIVIGFSIAAPIGPIGLLCIKRSLARGPAAGLVTGLGAATADAFYGFVAGFGLTFITGFLLNMKTELHTIGGLFLCFLGWQALKPGTGSKEGTDSDFKGYPMSYLSALVLTLTNPMTIMAFMAIFAGLGLAASDNGYTASAILVAGVFTGSALWWILLTFGTARLGTRLSRNIQEKTNRITGIVLILFGVWALASLAL